MIRYLRLFSKHNLFSINDILNNLLKISSSENEDELITAADIIEVLDNFKAELQTRLHYLATDLIEILHNYFTNLNEVIAEIFPKTSKLPPADMRDSLWGLFWITILFAHEYNKEHYNSLKPSCPDYLKQHY